MNQTVILKMRRKYRKDDEKDVSKEREWVGGDSDRKKETIEKWRVEDKTKPLRTYKMIYPFALRKTY